MDDVQKQLIELLDESEVDFTDIRLSLNEPIMVRVAQGWVPLTESVIVDFDSLTHIMQMLDVDWDQSIQHGAINRPLMIGPHRLRASAYLVNASLSQTIFLRQIKTKPPTLEETGLPPTVKIMSECPRGLILVSGATSSGKSTTIAALIDSVNKNKNAHIVTIEDPIEYVHSPINSIFSQREVGVDVSDYLTGVKDAMRQRPDIIVIGEIRDRETADAAILAGESGHLVIGSLHANSAASTISRLLSFFPRQDADQKRQNIASSLVGIINQLLIPKESGEGYALASELVFNHKGQFARYILDQEKSSEKINSALEKKEDGLSQPMIDSIVKLVASKVVTRQEALMSSWSSQSALYERIKNIS